MAWDSVGPIRVTQQPTMGAQLLEMQQMAEPTSRWEPPPPVAPVADSSRQEALLAALLAEVQALRAELASRSAYSRWVRFCSWVRTLWP